MLYKYSDAEKGVRVVRGYTFEVITLLCECVGKCQTSTTTNGFHAYNNKYGLSIMFDAYTRRKCMYIGKRTQVTCSSKPT